MMKIVVNGETREVRGEMALGELLESLSMPAGRIAVELNKEVVPKRTWPDVRVREGDRLEIVHFVGGG